MRNFGGRVVIPPKQRKIIAQFMIYPKAVSIERGRVGIAAVELPRTGRLLAGCRASVYIRGAWCENLWAIWQGESVQIRLH